MVDVGFGNVSTVPRSSDSMMDPRAVEPPFVQIATCAAENGHSLYALDGGGNVWEYYWIDRSQNPKDWSEFTPGWRKLSQRRIG